MRDEILEPADSINILKERLERKNTDEEETPYGTLDSVDDINLLEERLNRKSSGFRDDRRDLSSEDYRDLAKGNGYDISLDDQPGSPDYTEPGEKLGYDPLGLENTESQLENDQQSTDTSNDYPAFEDAEPGERTGPHTRKTEDGNMAFRSRRTYSETDNKMIQHLHKEAQRYGLEHSDAGDIYNAVPGKLANSSKLDEQQMMLDISRAVEAYSEGATAETAADEHIPNIRDEDRYSDSPPGGGHRI
jgi:hypothetical protein